MVALFAWAQVKGVQYRDFSAVRREYRAGMRQRAALAKRDAEAEAKAEAEQAAGEADRTAWQAGEAARSHASRARRATARQQMDEAAAEAAAREQALAQAEQASRQAAAERMNAARHAEALRAAEQAARREALEMFQARTAGKHPGGRSTPLVDRSLAAQWQTNEAEVESTVGLGSLRAAEPLPLGLALEDQDRRPGRDAHKYDARGMFALGEEADAELAEGHGQRRQTATSLAPGLISAPNPAETARTVQLAGGESGAGESSAAPAWFARPAELQGSSGERSPLRETLQHSREKVAARWYALRGLFGSSAPEAEPADFSVQEEEIPLLAVYSVAGGVGKTSLAASLTRALAAQGERVLLVDTTQRGVLPFYLGARELRPEVMRTFAPPAGSVDQAIHLVSYEMGSTTVQGEDLGAKIRRDGAGFSRIVVDVPSAADGTLEELIGLHADVLVPVTPDMNSVISLPAVRRALGGGLRASGKRVEPAFLLVQFDPTQPLQLDVREVLQQQLGDQLLPFSIRRSPVIAEALAEGMTVIDYAPGEGITKDFVRLAAWVRTLAEPAREGLAQARWSER